MLTIGGFLGALAVIAVAFEAPVAAPLFGAAAFCVIGRGG